MSKAVEQGCSEWLKRWRFQNKIGIYKKYQIDIVIRNTASQIKNSLSTFNSKTGCSRRQDWWTERPKLREKKRLERTGVRIQVKWSVASQKERRFGERMEQREEIMAEILQN